MISRNAALPVLAIALLLFAGPATSQPRVKDSTLPGLDLTLEVGQTRLVELTNRIVRISVSDPQIADVQVVTPLQVLVTAKAVGRTPLILWGDSDRPFVIQVESKRNLGELRSQIKELFPDEQITVGSTGDLVVLSGEVSDLRVPARVAELARLHSDRLANLVEVSGNQQVQLEVRFAEVSRTGMRKMGFNMLWKDSARGYVSEMVSPGRTAGTYLGVPGTSVTGGPPVTPGVAAADAFNILFSTGLSDFPFSAVLSVLAENGLSRVLAEPTLVAMSGQEASFHAGGEVPILISQSFGNVSVQYKKFGVQLKFVPTVLGDRTINLKIASEVSEPDAAAGVTLAGYQVPGFRTRNSDTTVRLKDGQSFAIAGLLSDSTRNVVDKVPGLGDIPILGALFRSTAFKREETELLVVVRVDMVKPIDSADVPPLPGEDEIFDPDDFQLFLLGRVDGSPKKDKDKGNRKGRAREAASTTGGPAGPVGFVRE